MYIEKNLLLNFKYRFFRTSKGKKQFRQMYENTGDKQQWIIKPKGLLIYNPKTIICEAQAIKAEFVSSILEIICYGEKQNGCSSEKERKVNALALRAEEGRDYLR